MITSYVFFPDLESVPTDAGLKVVWSLEEAFSAIIHNLTDDQRVSLFSSSHRAVFGSYRLYYIPGKLFSVNHKGYGEATYFELSQFFPNADHLGTSRELQKMADELDSTLCDLGITSPASLASPVAAFESDETFREALSTIPTIFTLPETFLGVADYALRCSGVDWTTAFQVGHFPELYSYDQASAFPSYASKLLDLNDCSIQHLDCIPAGAYYGFAHGKMTIFPDSPLAFLSSVMRLDDSGYLVNFVGTDKNFYTTLDVIRFVERHGIGRFDISDGFFLSPHDGVRPSRPFAPIMARLFNRRFDASPLASYLLKRGMNGIIGRLLQQKDNGDYGSLYNPIYYSLIVNHTPLVVADFLIQNCIMQDELVHIGTDGCKLTRKIPLPARSSVMGSWRCTGCHPTFVLSPSQIITTESKGLDYVALRSMIADHPRLSIYGNINLHLLAQQQDRNFPKLPLTGQSLLSGKYQSEAIVL